MSPSSIGLSQRGLAFRLTVFVLAATTLIFLAAFGYNYYQSRKLVLKNVRQVAMCRVEALVLQIEKKLRSVETLPTAGVSYLEGRRESNDQFLYLMREMVTTTPEIFGSTLAYEPYAFDPDRKFYAPYFYREKKGRVAFTQLGRESYNYFLRDWYLIPKELERSVWSEPYFDEGGGGILMATYSHPFYDLSGGHRKFAGVMTADISLEDLVTQINDISLYETGFAFLISRSGAFLAHPDKDRIMRESIFSMAEARDLPQLRAIGRQMIRGEDGFAAIAGIHKGRPTLLAFAPVPAAGWSVGIMIPERELFADIRTLSHTVLGIAAAGFVLLLVLITLIARSVTLPLKNLVKTTREIARGNLDVVLPQVRTRDEVQVLTRSVDGMRVALKEYISNIAETSRAQERIESELKIAKAIQMNFLPQHFPPFPEQPAFDLYAALEPAREVGGDLYDFFMLDDRRLFFSVGDVSDKGVPAALFMAVTKTLMKGIAEQQLPPSEVLARVNAELCQNNDSAMFVTLACGVLDVNSGQLNYSNAGHNPPVLIRKASPPEWLPLPPGLVLGAMEEAVFSTRTIELNPGDRLVFYTDGVTEAMDMEQNLFSEDRMMEELAKISSTEPQKMVERLMKAVHAHAEGTDQSDDITILALHYKGPETKSDQ